MEWTAKVAMRDSSNKLILAILGKYLEDNPGLRFHQALVNLGLWAETDPFYVESKDVLDSLVKTNPIAQHYIKGLKNDEKSGDN